MLGHAAYTEPSPIACDATTDRLHSSDGNATVDLLSHNTADALLPGVARSRVDDCPSSAKCHRYTSNSVAHAANNCHAGIDHQDSSRDAKNHGSQSSELPVAPIQSNSLPHADNGVIGSTDKNDVMSSFEDQSGNDQTSHSSDTTTTTSHRRGAAVTAVSCNLEDRLPYIPETL
jgi:hypothetical protein